jgi:hypothetical protein
MTNASPTETVGMVMGWLNSTFGLSVPVTPPSTWPAFFGKLWSMLVSPPLPQPNIPLPWVIEVEGNFEGLLPEGNTLEVKACVIVAHKTPASPPDSHAAVTSAFIPLPPTKSKSRKVNR